MRMFSPESHSRKQGSDPPGRAAVGWTWPAGIRVMLAACVFLTAVALRLNNLQNARIGDSFFPGAAW